MNAAIALPRAKVEKRVRSASAPSEPTRLWIETWKKMCPRPMSAGQTKSQWMSDTVKATASPAAMVSAPQTMGMRTPKRSEILPACTARRSGKVANSAARADRGRAGAELERVERNRDLAAALSDRVQHRQQNHEVNGHRINVY